MIVVSPWTSGRRPRRAGFTLMELLVVIALIAILMALALGGTFQVIETQRQSNTENALRAIDKVLQQQWMKVIEEARGEQPSHAVKVMAGNDPRRAQVLWVQLRLIEAFPENFAEIQNPTVYQNYTVTNTPFIPVNQRKNNGTYLKKLQTRKGTTSPATENIACLFMALDINRGGVRLSSDTLADSIRDTDGDGLRELVDSWGVPLKFVRFPISGSAVYTELDQSYTPPPKAGGNRRDPLDPEGVMMVGSAVWDGKTFQALFRPIADRYHVPIISSAGRNGRHEVVLADDIFSFRLRIGARGD
jgi:prepilin-type N-terminal cleavage/methylation domain-containing protein